MQEEFLCLCSKAYLCSAHIGNHIREPGHHLWERLNHQLPFDESKILHEKLLSALRDINLVIQGLTSESTELIKKVESFYHLAKSQLKSKAKTLMNLLSRKNFSDSETPQIKKVIFSDLTFRFPGKLILGDEIEKFFRQGFWVNENQSESWLNYFSIDLEKKFSLCQNCNSFEVISQRECSHDACKNCYYAYCSLCQPCHYCQNYSNLVSKPCSHQFCTNCSAYARPFYCQVHNKLNTITECNHPLCSLCQEATHCTICQPVYPVQETHKEPENKTLIQSIEDFKVLSDTSHQQYRTESSYEILKESKIEGGYKLGIDSRKRITNCITLRDLGYMIQSFLLKLVRILGIKL